MDTPITSTQSAVQVLNDILAHSPEACQKLLSLRVEVSSKIDSVVTVPSGDKFKLGLLGVLNGILDAQKQERVAAMFDDSDSLVGFAAYKPK